MAETKKTTEEKLVKIKLPRIKGKEEEFVRVNERTWLIQRGVTVEVPECVANMFEMQEAMEEEAYRFEQEAMK